jgi:lambda family phage minor tail protein L
MTIKKDIQRLDPGARVELFDLDATSLGGSISYFHAGTDQSTSAIVWQGHSYLPWPVQASGFEYNGRGQLPTPRMKIANVGGLITALNLAYDDLVGAKLTRKRTFARYLDGEPAADPTAGFPDDVFYVDRKVSENKVFVEYELGSALDVHGVKIPIRQANRNACTWVYRSAECTYAGGAVADINDLATEDINEDRCSKKLTGCRLRHAGNLPYGGFPGLSRF